MQGKHYINTRNIIINDAPDNANHFHGGHAAAPIVQQLNVYPLDRSLVLIKQKQVENSLHAIQEPYDFRKFAEKRDLQGRANGELGNRPNLKSRLKTAPLYTKYPAANLPYSIWGDVPHATSDDGLPSLPQLLDVNMLTKMPVDQLSRWVSQTGVLSLIERGIVQKAVQEDMSSILKGSKGKSYLRAIKSRVFPMELKADLGSIWEQPRRVYLPALRLDKAYQLHDPLVNEENMYVDFTQQHALKQILDADDAISSIDVQNSSLVHYDEDVEKSLLSQSVNQINPTYSSGWVLYIQNGRLLESGNPSFCSYYKTITNLNLQSAAGILIESILKWAVMYSIPLITVKCSQIIKLCRDPLCFPIPTKKLLNCIFNEEEVFKLMSKKTRLYLNGNIGKEIAARTIQYYYNRYRTRVQRKQEELNYRAKKRIKAFFLRYSKKKSFQKIIKERMSKGMRIFESIQANYLRDGGNLFIASRIIICICPPEKFSEPFNHLERAFSLSLDPDVSVILVLHNPPYNLTEQVARVFDIGRQGNPIVKGRLHIVVTEISSHLPKNSPAGSSLLLSPKALKKVKELCRKKFPVIVAESMTKYVAALCHEINCPFYGSTLQVSQKIQENALEIYSWMEKAELPLMPAFEMSRSHKDAEIIDKATQIRKRAPEVKRWIFRRYDRFGKKHITFDYVEKLGIDPSRNSMTTMETSRLFWVFGGLLEAIPSANEYKLLQVGAQLDPNGSWKILATTETNIVELQEIGLIIPQQTIACEELTALLSRVTVCLKDNFYTGYFTVLIYAWQDPVSKYYTYKISSIVTYLNRAILHSIAFATKSRLVLDPKIYTLHLEADKTPWEPPHLTSNSDQLRWNNQFKNKLPKESKRIIFSTETIHHALFEHLKTSVCAISLQRRGIMYDPWAVVGTEFPYSETKFPVICVGQTLEQVYEDYLVLVTKIEELAAESDFLFKHNLYWVALNVLQFLQRERIQNSGDALSVFPAEFENEFKSVGKLLKPYLDGKWKNVAQPQEQKTESIVSTKVGVSAETLMLLSREIPSIVAMSRDPSLKNPTVVSKLPKKKVLDSKKAEDRAAALIDILENPRIPKAKKQDTPWSKLLA